MLIAPFTVRLQSMLQLTWLAVLSSSLQAAPQTKDQLIDGVRRNYEAFRKLRTVQVTYSLDFQPLSKPPRFGYAHLDVINLSQGKALRTHIKATGVRGDSDARDERTATWDGKVAMTSRQGGAITIDSRPDNLLFYYRYFFDYLFYPEGSGQITNQAGALPVGQSEDWVPLVLNRLRSEYQLRPATESIDGHECYVLERPNRDRIWIDPGVGYILRRREFFQKDKAELRSRTQYASPEQKLGFWYPTVIVREDFAPPIGKPDAPSSAVSRFELKVTGMSVGEVAAAEFRLPIPYGSHVVDSIRKLTYTRVDSPDAVIAQTLAEAKTLVKGTPKFWPYILGASLFVILIISFLYRKRLLAFRNA